jgi:cytoskeletal protein RodZ
MIPAVNSWVTNTWNSFSSQTSSQSLSSTENPLLTGTMPVPSPLPISLPKTSTDNKTIEPIINNKMAAESISEIQKNSNNKQTGVNSPQPIQTETAQNIIIDPEKKTPKEEARIPDSGNGMISLKLVFNKEVWMRIRDGKKKTVFEGQNPAGEEKILELKKPLSFRVGNAQGLTLFVDDKKVDISNYTKGSVANFTLE